MAEDEGTRPDDDVEGHTVTRATPDERKSDAPGVETAKAGEEDDVAGHEMTAKSAEPGKKEAPGTYTP